MSEPHSADRLQGLHRRKFLQAAGAASALLVVAPPLVRSAAAGAPARWSDPATWGGSVPGKNNVAVISKPVLLDVDAKVAGVQIKRGGTLIFDPTRRITLKSTGNVVVRGKLKMRPASGRKQHRLIFVGVNENRFRGGGMDVLGTDVGLWVMGAGVLDIAGTRKRAWTRAAGSIAKGTRSLRLKADPRGWHVGDEIVITPTVSPRNKNHHSAFDKAKISAIRGRRITLSAPTTFAHPKVEVRRGKVFTAEVLNLTRNVRIEGTRRGRAHIFIRSRRPQEIKFASVRFMGPRKVTNSTCGELGNKVLGRWALHFHHCMHHSHGSMVRGVVARDCGAHAFVPHVSHGVRFVDCIAYKNLETPFWWDEPTSEDPSLTRNVEYSSCVAARVLGGGEGCKGGTDLVGFKMAQGSGNSARSCVAVGVSGQNGGDSTGFSWMGKQNGLWNFEGCTAHNNKNLGTRFWINDPAPHVLREFTAYHNRTGSFNGAYGNSVDYVDSIYHGNAVSAIEAKATRHIGPQRFVRVSMDQTRLTDYCMHFDGHVNEPGGEILIRECNFKGYRRAALGFDNSTDIPDLLDVVDCNFSGNAFWLGNDIHPDSRIRVQDPEHGALKLSRWDQVLEGDYRPEWNARVKKIKRFA